MTLPLRVLGTIADCAATFRQWKEVIEGVTSFEALDRPSLVPFSAPQNGIYHVDHRLGRVPRGWIIVAPDNDCTIWQAKPADLTQLHLSTDATVTCRLWVW